jgi:hypothetical protein
MRNTSQKASQVMIFQALSIAPDAASRLRFAAEVKRQIEEKSPKEPHVLIGAIEDAAEAARKRPHDTQAFESALTLYRAAARWYKTFAFAPESLHLAAWSESIAASLDALQAALVAALPLQPKGNGIPPTFCEGRR